MTDRAAFSGKRVLITGHTGFKGAWLSIWLRELGAQVIGVALDPLDERCLYVASGIGDHIRDLRCDIRDGMRLRELFEQERPEVVLHLAARSLVLDSYRSPASTFDVNVMGTVNVLEAIRHTPSVRAGVMVTTDKCYENREWTHAYRETDALGGHDPYSASKGAAEIAIASYRRSFFSTAGSPGIASARSGNVIGGGDWSADRIVPDLFRAVEQGRSLGLRNPGSIRPWQHVLEPLSGYLVLAARLLDDPGKFAEAWNFGPSSDQIHTVRELAEAMITGIGKGAWHEVEHEDKPHEARLLLLDMSKAMLRLGWKPRLSFERTVKLTSDWYARHASEEALALCHEQIHEFERLADH